MAINKVVRGNEVVLDLTNTTVDAAHLAKGYTAVDRHGDAITGTMEEGGGGAAGGDYNVESVINGDGTQNIVITDAEGGGGGGGGFDVPDGFKMGSFTIATTQPSTNTNSDVVTINHGLGRTPRSILCITDSYLSSGTSIKQMHWHQSPAGTLVGMYAYTLSATPWGGTGSTYENIQDVTETSFTIRNKYNRFYVGNTYIWIAC